MERWTGVLSRRHSYRCPVMAFVSPPAWPPFPLCHGHRFSAGVATVALSWPPFLGKPKLPVEAPLKLRLDFRPLRSLSVRYEVGFLSFSTLIGNLKVLVPCLSRLIESLKLLVSGLNCYGHRFAAGVAIVSPPSWPLLPCHGHRCHLSHYGMATVATPSWPPLPTSGVSVRCRVVSRRFASFLLVVHRCSLFSPCFSLVFLFVSRSFPANTKLSLAISSRHARRHGRVSGGCVNCFRSALVFWQKKRERPRYPSRGIHNLQTIGVLPRAEVVAPP